MFSRITERFPLKKLEPFLFALCILLTLWPIVITKYFLTLDGPSHLYNANLLKELFSGKQDNLSDLFRFNPVPVPNWTGHFIMAFFNLFFPAFLSEKLMMLIYFILTPLFFRKSLLFFEPKNRFCIYLIFPLLHNNLFYFGFFNMCLGITAMFAAFSYFLHSGGKTKIKQFLVLSILLGIAFFSHLMAFLMTFALLLVFSFVFLDIRKDVNRYHLSNFSSSKKRLLWVLICALPWLILSVNYFVKIDSIETQSQAKLAEHLEWIRDFRPLLTISVRPPLITYSRIFSGLFACLILAQIFLTVKRRKLLQPGTTAFEYRNAASSAIFLILCIVLLCLFLFLPNSIMLCDRLLVLSYLFFVCWLSLIKFPKWISVLSLVIIIYVQSLVISFYDEQIKQSPDHVEKMVELATHIPEGNFVLVLNHSGNWMYDHASGYIGANRRLAVLENYEAGLSWFPVNWNPARFAIDGLVNNMSSNKTLACSFFVNKPDSMFFSLRQKNGVIVPVDYVFQMGNIPDDQDLCNAQTQTRLDSSYNIVRENNFCRLYIRKH